jgi:hypothetical protein
MRRVTMMVDVTVQVPDDFDDLDALDLRINDGAIWPVGDGGQEIVGSWVQGFSVESAKFIEEQPPGDLYLFLMNDTGALVRVPRRVSGVEWASNYSRFFVQFGKGNKLSPDDVRAVRLYEDQKIGEVYYSEGLAGPRGCWFNVYQLPGNTESDVVKAVSQLKQDRDVVHLQKLKVTQLVDFAWEGAK